MMQPFCPNGATTIVTPGAASAASRLIGGSAVRIVNSGAVSVWIKFGKAGVAAAVTDMEIPAGQTEVFLIPGNCEFIAYITAAAPTGTLNLTTGEGP